MLGTYQIRISAEALGFGRARAQIKSLQGQIQSLQSAGVLSRKGNAQLQQLQRQQKAMRNALGYKGIVAGAALGSVSMGVGRSLGKASDMAAEYTHALEKLAARQGKDFTDADRDRFSQFMKQLGQDTKFTTLELIRASDAGIKMGASIGEIRRGMKDVTDFATASDMSPERSLSIMKAVGDKFGRSWTEVGNVITKVADETRMTAEEFGEISRALAATRMGGGRFAVGLETFATMMAASRGSTQTIGQSSTAFANFITNALGTKSGQLQKDLNMTFKEGLDPLDLFEPIKNYMASLTETQATAWETKIFGKRGFRQLEAALDFTKDFGGDVGKLKGVEAMRLLRDMLTAEAGGTLTADKADRLLGTAEGAKALVTGAWQNFMIEIGQIANEAITPIRRQLYEFLKVARTFISSLGPSGRKLLGWLMVSIPFVLGLVGAISMLAGLAMLASSPIFLVVGGISALLGTIITLAGLFASKWPHLAAGLGTLITKSLKLAWQIFKLFVPVDFIMDAIGYIVNSLSDFFTWLEEKLLAWGILSKASSNPDAVELSSKLKPKTGGTLPGMPGLVNCCYEGGKVQTNNIKVEIQGNGDPDKIAKAIGIELDKRNGSMLNQAHKALVPNHGAC